MSYRDIKNFCEMARVLGYPRLISIENFRQPNFVLLAELLKWLVKRYDPHVDLPTEIDTEADRILFVKSVAQFMATKAHIKLNTKKLYQADGTVVKELLKMTSVLYNALKLSNENENQDDIGASGVVGASLSMAFDISSQIGDLRRARELASEITSKGATIYELLANEVELRDLRNFTINRNLELTEVENEIMGAIKACRSEQEKIKTKLGNIELDEKNLDDKIEKKKADLDRNQKRLRTLKDVRPAYMDDYEQYEKELEVLYQEYLVKFRIQLYLEQQLDEFNQSEQEKFEDSTRRMQMSIKKMRDQEKERNGTNPFLDADVDELMESADSAPSDDDDVVEAMRKPNGKSQMRGGKQPQMAKARSQGRNFGAMDADLSGGSEDDDDDDGEDDDDDDDDEDGDEEVAGHNELDEDDDDMPLARTNGAAVNRGMAMRSGGPNARKAGVAGRNDSDDDF